VRRDPFPLGDLFVRPSAAGHEILNHPCALSGQRYERTFLRSNIVSASDLAFETSPRMFRKIRSKTGIAPIERLVDQAMSQEPAHRVFWIMDNGCRSVVGGAREGFFTPR
jgi:hypothetical protein